MKTINVTFTEDEYETLVSRKGSRNWHDFILNKKGGKKNDAVDGKNKEGMETQE